MKEKCNYCQGTGRWITGKVICRDGKSRRTRVNCPACQSIRSETAQAQRDATLVMLETLRLEAKAWRRWCCCTDPNMDKRTERWNEVMEAVANTDKLKDIGFDAIGGAF